MIWVNEKVTEVNGWNLSKVVFVESFELELCEVFEIVWMKGKSTILKEFKIDESNVGCHGIIDNSVMFGSE